MEFKPGVEGFLFFAAKKVEDIEKITQEEFENCEKTDVISDILMEIFIDNLVKSNIHNLKEICMIATYPFLKALDTKKDEEIVLMFGDQNILNKKFLIVPLVIPEKHYWSLAVFENINNSLDESLINKYIKTSKVNVDIPKFKLYLVDNKQNTSDLEKEITRLVDNFYAKYMRLVLKESSVPYIFRNNTLYTNKSKDKLQNTNEILSGWTVLQTLKCIYLLRCSGSVGVEYESQNLYAFKEELLKSLKKTLESRPQVPSTALPCEEKKEKRNIPESKSEEDLQNNTQSTERKLNGAIPALTIDLTSNANKAKKQQQIMVTKPSACKCINSCTIF